MKQISLHPLCQGTYALVDDDDYERLKTFKWCSYRGLYAWRYTSTAEKAKRKAFYMHREVLHAPPGAHVDHINGNRLDNRKSNLRLATNSQNQGNRKPNKSKRGSRYKGVYTSGWIAAIQKNGRKHYIGTYATEIEAARAYNSAALEFFGAFAKLNEV